MTKNQLNLSVQYLCSNQTFLCHTANQETKAFGVVMLFALDKSLSYFECHRFLPWKCKTYEF